MPQYLRIQSALLGWRLYEASKRDRDEAGILNLKVSAKAPTTISSFGESERVLAGFSWSQWR